ncbi:DUF1750-domain-containing protein [Thozetella sp. PMI_491]|nr:DUF1750-domain-containing protein [Thozetella sp. PMI_491]
MANVAPTDPSQSVHEQLLPHIHLLSTHRFPHKPRVELREVIEWLMQAPKIARDTAPFYWTYLDCPTDGTIHLIWQPTTRRQTEFASDGYIWPGPERFWRQETGNGLFIEVYYQGCGYRPGAQVAAHSRRRFRLVPAQAGGPNTPPFDSNLWVVHYGPSEKNERIPVAQIPISPPIHQAISSRQQLMHMGKITRKDFMLSDRVNWPRIPLPGRSQSMYGAPVQNRAVPQQMAYAPHGPPAVGPAPKRRGAPAQQQQHHGQMIGQQPQQVLEPYEDEEDTSRGDMFDHLNPRDVSLSRYKQNHEWMEEIVSSPYRVDQIVMADLNLGLRGELSSLTVNIFEAQGSDALDRVPEKPYLGRLDKGLAEEFTKRCKDKTAALEAEIEQLKAQHEKTVADFKKRSVLKLAEKDLRNSVESTGPEFWRLEGREEVNIDSDEEAPVAPQKALSKKIEDILAEVEASLNKTPITVYDVQRIQDGGFQEPPPEPEVVIPPPQPQASSVPQGLQPQQQPSHNGSQGSGVPGGDSDVDMGGTAAGMMDQLQGGFLTSASATNVPTPQPQQPGSNGSTPAPTSAPQPPVPQPAPSEDVKMEDASAAKDPDGDWVVVPKGGVSPLAAPASAPEAQPVVSAVDVPSAPSVSDSKPASAAQTPGDALTFDSNDFSSLGDLNTAGDALAGYEDTNPGEDLGDLNMDMEDSAFGDAFHAVDPSSNDDGL